MSDRISTAAAVSEALDSLSVAELVEKLSGDDARPGWGMSRTLDIEGREVFAKTVPLTNAELDRYPSTSNLFDLPVTYQYGVGSAGFGAARELAAHEKTTRWVMEGRCPHFPLLYHHRVLPLTGQTHRRDEAQLDRYVTYWDGASSIAEFIRARESAEFAIALFIEHIPHALMDWLPDNQAKVSSVIEQAVSVTNFLRSERIVHFDANTSNVLTDGTQIYLCDFGLWLDDDFELSEVEREFLQAHRHFDIAEFLASLVWPVPGREFEHSDLYRSAIEQYRPVIEEMTAVFERLTSGPKSAGGYDDALIRTLLDHALS